MMKKHLLTFIALLQNHIHKEDEVLYKMAEQLNDVSGDGDSLMLENFEKIATEYNDIVREFNHV